MLKVSDLSLVDYTSAKGDKETLILVEGKLYSPFKLEDCKFLTLALVPRITDVKGLGFFGRGVVSFRTQTSGNDYLSVGGEDLCYFGVEGQPKLIGNKKKFITDLRHKVFKCIKEIAEYESNLNTLHYSSIVCINNWKVSLGYANDGSLYTIKISSLVYTLPLSEEDKLEISYFLTGFVEGEGCIGIFASAAYTSFSNTSLGKGKVVVGFVGGVGNQLLRSTKETSEQVLFDLKFRCAALTRELQHDVERLTKNRTETVLINGNKLEVTICSDKVTEVKLNDFSMSVFNNRYVLLNITRILTGLPCSYDGNYKGAGLFDNHHDALTYFGHTVTVTPNTDFGNCEYLWRFDSLTVDTLDTDLLKLKHRVSVYIQAHIDALNKKVTCLTSSTAIDYSINGKHFLITYTKEGDFQQIEWMEPGGKNRIINPTDSEMGLVLFSNYLTGVECLTKYPSTGIFDDYSFTYVLPAKEHYGSSVIKLPEYKLTWRRFTIKEIPQTLIEVKSRLDALALKMETDDAT